MIFSFLESRSSQANTSQVNTSQVNTSQAEAASKMLEVAIVDVKQGNESICDAVFSNANRLLRTCAGYLDHEMNRCGDAPGRYIMMIEWQGQNSDRASFRATPEYQQWRRMLHQL